MRLTDEHTFVPESTSMVAACLNQEGSAKAMAVVSNSPGHETDRAAPLDCDGSFCVAQAAKKKMQAAIGGTNRIIESPEAGR